MYITHSRTFTKTGRKRTITCMLRKEQIWNHIKCSIKTTKGINRLEDKYKKKNKK